MKCKVEQDLDIHLKKVDEDEARENEFYKIVRELTESDYNDGAPEFEQWARRRAEKIIFERII